MSIQRDDRVCVQLMRKHMCGLVTSVIVNAVLT